MITIERVDNGYIVKNSTGEKEFDTTVVIEEQDTEHGEVLAGRDLLWTILEQIGLYGSKHDARRIRIKVVNNEGEVVDD